MILWNKKKKPFKDEIKQKTPPYNDKCFYERNYFWNRLKWMVSYLKCFPNTKLRFVRLKDWVSFSWSTFNEPISFYSFGPVIDYSEVTLKRTSYKLKEMIFCLQSSGGKFLTCLNAVEELCTSLTAEYKYSTLVGFQSANAVIY